MDTGGIHHGGIAIDRASMNACMVTDASGRQRVVEYGRAGGQCIVIVDQNADPGADADIGVATATGLCPDAVTTEQGDLTVTFVGQIDRTAATGIHVNTVVFVAHDRVEDVKRGACTHRERRQPTVGIGDGQRVEAAPPNVDGVGAAIDDQGRTARTTGTDYIRKNRVGGSRWRAIDRGAAEGDRRVAVVASTEDRGSGSGCDSRRRLGADRGIDTGGRRTRLRYVVCPDP